MAMAFAKKVGATYVLANDPDADRFAASEKLSDGTWYQFTGNQLGTLLAYQIWAKYKGKDGKFGMLASAVSSKMLQTMGKVEGFHFEETLTGFKWLGNRAIELKTTENIDIIFAYEEAIGFMVEDIVRDKDGISAMLVFVELAAELRKRSYTVLQHLNELYRKYGIFVESNSYYISNDPVITSTIFNTIRYGQAIDGVTSPASLAYPKTLGSFRVTRIRDLTIGYDSASTLPDHRPTLPVSTSSHMITFQLVDEAGLSIDLTLRTSGTEPKIKYYSEISKHPNVSGESISLETTERELKELHFYLQNAVKDILEVLLDPKKYGLTYE